MARVAKCSNKNTSCSVIFEIQINNIFFSNVCLKHYMGHSHTNHKYCMGYPCTGHKYSMGYSYTKKNNLLFISNSDLTGRQPLFYLVILLVAIELPFFSG